MNRVDIEDFRRADNRRDVQISLGRGRGADANWLVCKPHVQRVAIDVAVHGNGADTHLFAGPNDATGNLAAVGDENLSKTTLSVAHETRPKSKDQNSKSKTARILLVFDI